MKTLVMFGGKVLIERAVAEDVTKGGIVLPDQSKRRPAMGTVKSAGPAAQKVLGCGDLVAFSEGVGEEIAFDGKKFLIVHVDDIHGRVLDSERAETLKS